MLILRINRHHQVALHAVKLWMCRWRRRHLLVSGTIVLWISLQALLALAAAVTARDQVKAVGAVALAPGVADAEIMRLRFGLRVRCGVQIIHLHLSLSMSRVSGAIRHLAVVVDHSPLLLDDLVESVGVGILRAAHIISLS